MTRSKERGFSLVEVVVALGLLAGVLISIAGLWIWTQSTHVVRRFFSEVSTLARTLPGTVACTLVAM